MTTNASCNDIGLADVLSVQDYQLYSTYTLGFWACQSIPTEEKDPTYYIYFSNIAEYELSGDTMTCTISSIQPAVFPVMYQSSTRLFSTQKPITTSSPNAVSNSFIEYAISILGWVVQQAQTPSGNLVEGIIFTALRDIDASSWGQLYEAMIQGYLVDQVCTTNNSSLPLLMVVLQLTYVRFIYLIRFFESPPVSCNRPLNGTLSVEVTGWVAKPVHIGLLMPMTVLNLASLIVVLISIARAKRDCHEFDVTDLRSLVLAESSLDESEPSGWADSVSYHSREVRECQI